MNKIMTDNLKGYNIILRYTKPKLEYKEDDMGQWFSAKEVNTKIDALEKENAGLKESGDALCRALEKTRTKVDELEKINKQHLSTNIRLKNQLKNKAKELNDLKYNYKQFLIERKTIKVNCLIAKKVKELYTAKENVMQIKREDARALLDIAEGIDGLTVERNHCVCGCVPCQCGTKQN